MVDKLMTINREHIIAAMKEAGFDIWVNSVGPVPNWIERFYAIAFKAGVDATVPKAFAAGAASRDADNAELVAALEMIAWSNDSEWQADCAKAALAKVRKP